MRYLRKRGRYLNKLELSQLIKEILAGPNREKYHVMDDDEWRNFSNYEKSLRLNKLVESGAAIPKYALNALDKLQQGRPWRHRGDHSEEFPLFVGTGGGFVDFDDAGQLENFSKMDGTTFIEWAKTQNNKKWDCSGGWAVFCDDDPDAALALLEFAGKTSFWPIAPWYDALSRFMQNAKKLSKKQPRRLADLVLDIDANSLTALDLQLSRWLEIYRTSLGKRKRREIWKKIWDVSHPNRREIDVDFDTTLNHSGGILAAILMAELGEYIPTVNAIDTPSLPKQLRKYFMLFQDDESQSAQIARIRLASSLLYLYRIDKDWTKSTLIDRMDPQTSQKFEPGLWEAFLWAPRIAEDLFQELKIPFVSILQNLNLIPKRVHSNAVQLLIDIAVPPDRGIAVIEAQKILQDLEPEDLGSAASMLSRKVTNSGSKSHVFWRETVGPWFSKAWPKHQDAKTGRISQEFVSMAIGAGDAFPAVLENIKDIVQPVEWGNPLRSLGNSKLHQKFPEQVWHLIKLLVDEKTHLAGTRLADLLDEIELIEPAIRDDQGFQVLRARL